MKKISKILMSSALATTLVVPTVAVYAASPSKQMEEVSVILNQKTDSPELWLEFIEEMKYDSTGKWLPELIIKLAAESSTTEIVDEKPEIENPVVSEAVIVTSTQEAIIEGYDHGPGLSKVVLKPSEALDITSLSTDTFKVTTVTTYKDIDYTTFTVAEEATDHENEREVTAVYLSDAEGNKVEDGEYITLELYVSPTTAGSSPFNYDFLAGTNSYIPFYFNVSVNEGESIYTEEGDAVEFTPVGINEYMGYHTYISDEFEHNQEYSQDGIDLLYASFKPETASEEVGSNPLIIWLHGAGEGGTETSIAILGNKVVNLATDDVQQYFGDTGAYILAPQSPTMWMDYDGTGTYNNGVEGSKGESYYTEALMGLIESYVEANPEIDPNRIYIGGCSNGGYMTVNMITTYPEYFAAA
ncbi:MAG: prolyl oligopeptidase family serine peptidase, partial [Lachnospirales bacterium]